MHGKIPFAIVLGLLAWCPLLLGSHRPIFWSINGLLTALALLAMVGSYYKRPLPVPFRAYWGVTIALSFVGVFMVVQYFPFAPDWLANPAWGNARDVVPVSTSAITIDREATFDAILRFATYVMIAFLIFQICRSADRALTLVRAVFWICLFYAAYGLLIQLSGSNRVLWFERFAYEGALVGTFIGRNAFAAFVGIGMICATGLILASLSRVLRRSRDQGGFSTSAVIEELTKRGGFYIIGLIVMLSALFLTASRAGTLSSLVACALMVLVWSVSSTKAGAWRGILAATLGFLVLAIGAISGAALLDRLDTTGDSIAFRLELYRAALNAIGERPMLGWGAGTYPSVFPIFRPPEVPSAQTFAEVHNSYLETIATLGVLAATAIFCVILYAAWRCLYAQWTRRSHRTAPLVGLGVATLFALHSILDFSLQFQANALLFTALLSAGVAQSWRRNAL